MYSFSTYGPSLLIFVGGLLAAVGASWALLRIRESSPRREKLYAALVIFAGTAIGLAGSLWAGLQEDRFKDKMVELNTKVANSSEKVVGLSQKLLNKTEENQQLSQQLAQKSDEVARLNQVIAASVTGGDSFCYMSLALGQGETNSPDLVFVHQGKYPLYDITVRIVDLDKWEQLGLTAQNLFKAEARINIGNLSLNQASALGTWPLPNSDQQRYNLFFVARNGFWTQLLRLRRVQGRWKVATRITQESGKKVRVLFEKIDKDFPRDKLGMVQWN